MSTVDKPTSDAAAPVDTATASQTTLSEDKGKSKVAKPDNAMDEDEDEDDEDEEDEDEEADEDDDDDDMEDEEELSEIRPDAILPPGRRTRGIKVDYTSPEAIAKAGLANGNATVDADDEDEF